jgi:hypothetical protein
MPGSRWSGRTASPPCRPPPVGHPLGGFEPPADRRYRVVALVTGEGTAAGAAGADHVVQVPFDPGTFTTDLIEASDRRPA